MKKLKLSVLSGLILLSLSGYLVPNTIPDFFLGLIDGTPNAIRNLANLISRVDIPTNIYRNTNYDYGNHLSGAVFYGLIVLSILDELRTRK